MTSIDLPSKIKLNTDNWDDVGKVYTLLEYLPIINSTAVKLTIQHNEEITVKTVPHHYIEWVNE